jgi:DNA invertase Pin-like site-specific DNA recombinase
MKVALYARVSTKDKGQDPELQLRAMREYALRQGWEVEEYVDHASAADFVGRSGWQRLLADVRRRQIDHILVFRLDRAFRSTRECLNTLQEFEHRRVGFSALLQDIDTTSPSGRLLLTILAAVAEFERDLIRERVREGMSKARRDGKSIGRPSALRNARVRRAWKELEGNVRQGHISQRQAARQIGVGLGTIQCFLAVL